MKALYLDIGVKYMTPTRNLIVSLLKNIFEEVDIYGPGYQEKDVLLQGVKKFVADKGGYDFIISSEMIIFANEAKPYTIESKKDILKSFFLDFSIELISEDIILDMHNFFINAKDKKIAYLVQTDFYNMRPSQINLLKSIANLFFITFGKDIICAKDEQELINRETFGYRSSNLWYNFVNEYSSKIISLPHFVSDIEFNYSPIKDRKFDIYVPGVNYWFRKQVLNIVKDKYYMPSKLHMKIYSLLTKLKLKPFSFDLGIELYNFLFRKAIFSSKATFTCGSALKWPLRKFFEIPAGGSLLICYPFYNQHEYGFVNNENCIEVKKPEEINIVLNDFEKDIKKFQKIAINGQNMILKYHSLQARTMQLKKALKVIVEKQDNFCGAYFKNGEFLVYEQ